ncbi:MAG: 2-hydroxyacid dehydrogenase [Solirubrobacteraceae bacterium]|nr:2-hydroxyacid dehydrogenase [Solirubrobacteraceae bacterium]
MSLLVLSPSGLIAEIVDATDGLKAVRFDPTDPVPPAAGAEAEAIVTMTEHAREIRELFGRLPKLLLVQTQSAGFDAWVDHLPPGVQLSNCRGAHGRATAELVIGMLLSILRELPEFGEDQALEDWATRTTDSLFEQRVLILGAGDLATHLTAMLEPFGSHVTRVGRTAREGVVTLADVPALLPDTDIVVALLPLSDETRHLIDQAFLAALPDGAIVVNAGRGPLVDTDALLAELESGRLRAALDVTDPEPLPAGHPLWKAPGLLLTPHVGGDTLGFEERAARICAGQIAEFARGERPENLVIE